MDVRDIDFQVANILDLDGTAREMFEQPGRARSAGAVGGALMATTHPAGEAENRDSRATIARVGRIHGYRIAEMTRRDQSPAFSFWVDRRTLAG